MKKNKYLKIVGWIIGLFATYMLIGSFMMVYHVKGDGPATPIPIIERIIRISIWLIVMIIGAILILKTEKKKEKIK